MSTINPNISQILEKSIRDIKPIDYYLDGILKENNFMVLAEAITLLESEVAEHRLMTDKILAQCFKHRSHTRRIGITGSPGVGKSSFIEKIALKLKKSGGTIAVLSIDPTSVDNRGSILGDKTRMTTLSQHNEIFIRPSPSRSHLGGTNMYTYEAIIMCEAAGIELIIIETVGVGQSEHQIREMVDCTVLLLLPGAGDDLQGIKKGITEIADIVIINKADGERVNLANKIQKDYRSSSHLARLNKSEWIIPVLKYSSLNGEGEEEVLKQINAYFQHTKANDFYLKNRLQQQKKWLNMRVEEFCIDSVRSLLLSQNNLNTLLENGIDSQDSPFDILHRVKKGLKIDLSFQ
jgi:LAO/AO transport system kinase